MSPTRPLFFADSASAAIEAPLAATVGLGLLFAALMLAESLWPLARRPVEARGRLFANFGMGVLNFGLTALLPLSIPAVALLAESRSWGLLNLIGAPFWVAAPATVLAASLAQYAFHRAAHAWPPLWRLHRAHHCDTAVDLSTTLRNHPLELLAIVPWLSAVALVLGLSPAILALYQVASLAFSMWTHANIGLGPRTDRLLRLLFVTPPMHHVHHSAERRETDSNYGDVLSLWDRMFGTYADLDRARLDAMCKGLGPEEDARAGHLVHQLIAPFGSRRSVRTSTPRHETGL